MGADNVPSVHGDFVLGGGTQQRFMVHGLMAAGAGLIVESRRAYEPLVLPFASASVGLGGQVHLTQQVALNLRSENELIYVSGGFRGTMRGLLGASVQLPSPGG